MNEIEELRQRVEALESRAQSTEADVPASPEEQKRLQELEEHRRSFPTKSARFRQ